MSPDEELHHEAAHDGASRDFDEQLYCLVIEKVFLELRGAPLSLSPKDWQTARDWYEKGIPLDLVERTLHEIFARRDERRSAQDKKTKRDTVLSLRFCRRSVEAAWKRRQEMLAPATTDEAPKLDVASRLGRLAAALPATLENREIWARRIIALAAPEDGPAAAEEAVEESLQHLDAELLAAARAALGAVAREELAEDLRKSLAALARRLPAADVERVRPSLEARLLRQRLELPVLSLFAAEAEEVD